MKVSLIKDYIDSGTYRGEIVHTYNKDTYSTIIVGISHDDNFYEIKLFVPNNLNPRSNFVKFMQSTNISLDGEIDLRELVGLNVMVTVKDQLKNDGNIYSSIKRIVLDSEYTEEIVDDLIAL